MIQIIRSLGFAAALAFAIVSSAEAQVNVMFIFDASGSMKRSAGNESRIVAAKRAFGEALASMPAHVRIGLIAFGHRKRQDCSDIEFISPVGSDKPAKLASVVASFDAVGETPIAAAMDRAGDAMKAFKGQSNTIVLITDGLEECGGDPCAAAKRLVALGINVKVHVVGFALGAGQENKLKCIVDQTGGRFFEAKNAKALTTAFTQVRREVVAETQPPVKMAPASPGGPLKNLLSQEGGGQIVSAPSAAWAKIISGKDSEHIYVPPGEAVFAFKDDRLATFSAFSILIPETSGYNIKDFELFAADDLAGPWKSLGKFTTQNIRLFRTPYQEFKFRETTAKYLKFKALNRHSGGGNITIHQIRLIGRQ